MASAWIQSEVFSNVDAAWLHMEKPTNMAMITGVMTFDRPVDFDRFTDTIAYRLLGYRRFVQRVKKPSLPLGLPHWEDDPHFNLHAHLHRIALPEPGDLAILQDLVGDLMGTPLDFTKPLWQMHLVEGYGNGCALIVRLHHCIADGLALMQVVLSLADQEANAPWPEPPEKRRSEWMPFSWLFKPAADGIRLIRGTVHVAETIAHAGLETLIHPTRVLDAARLGTARTRALAKLLLIGPDQKTLFKGSCGVAKRAAWSRPIPIEDVKAIGQVIDGTVNDVLLTAVTGALRRYLEKRGAPTEGVDIRAVVPVNLRAPDNFNQLGNRFGLVFLSLPVGVQDTIKRLLILKRRMDQIKDTPEAVVAFGILNAIGMTPVQIENIIVKIFAMKGTAVMTNVPGPRTPLYFAGQKIRSFVFWVPSPGNLSLGVSIFSYSGEIVVGVATDAGLVPDPQAIIAGLHAEIDEMKLWLLSDQLEEIPLAAAEVAAADYPVALEVEKSPLATAEPAAGFNDRQSGFCQARTKAGKPCKNRALPGLQTCHIHKI